MTLRVVHAQNPRFSHMSDGQIAVLLEEARRVVAEHFQIDIKFTQPGQISISALFAHRPAFADADLEEWIYDFKRGGGKRDKLVEDLKGRLQQHGDQSESIFAFARPHLLARPKSEPAAGYAEALTSTLLRRLRVWRVLPASDKRTIIDDSKFNEWTH